MGEIPPRSLQALAVVRGLSLASRSTSNQLFRSGTPREEQYRGSFRDEPPVKCHGTKAYVSGDVFARMEDKVTA